MTASFKLITTSCSDTVTLSMIKDQLYGPSLCAQFLAQHKNFKYEYVNSRKLKGIQRTICKYMCIHSIIFPIPF